MCVLIVAASCLLLLSSLCYRLMRTGRPAIFHSVVALFEWAIRVCVCGHSTSAIDGLVVCWSCVYKCVSWMDASSIQVICLQSEKRTRKRDNHFPEMCVLLHKNARLPVWQRSNKHFRFYPLPSSPLRSRLPPSLSFSLAFLSRYTTPIEFDHFDPLLPSTPQTAHTFVESEHSKHKCIPANFAVLWLLNNCKRTHSLTCPVPCLCIHTRPPPTCPSFQTKEEREKNLFVCVCVCVCACVAAQPDQHLSLEGQRHAPSLMLGKDDIHLLMVNRFTHRVVTTINMSSMRWLRCLAVLSHFLPIQSLHHNSAALLIERWRSSISIKWTW